MYRSPFKTIALLFLALSIVLLCCAARLLRAVDEGIADIHFQVPTGFPTTVYDVQSNPPTAAGFELGRKLFYDPILSNDYLSSCASCHQRFAAFAHIDHALSHGAPGKIGFRNVPALQNLAWKDAFMADGGIMHLDLQPIAPITNPIELNESLENVIQKLQRDSIYPEMFRRAFGDKTISSTRMLKAMSQFLLMLVSADSRYDKMLRKEVQFTEQEQRGLDVFRARCVSCHPEPLFTDNSYRNILLPIDSALRDSGRARITGLASDNNRFKVPSLRNVEWTYPYMHDGRFRTLRQVLDFYASDPNTMASHNGTQIGDPSRAKPVGLSDEEKSELIIFLKSLSDSHFLHDNRFADPNRGAAR